MAQTGIVFVIALGVSGGVFSACTDPKFAGDRDGQAGDSDAGSTPDGSDADPQNQPNSSSPGDGDAAGDGDGDGDAGGGFDGWTEDRAGDAGYAHAATLYVNMSTWLPYQTILAAISVHLP